MNDERDPRDLPRDPDGTADGGAVSDPEAELGGEATQRVEDPIAERPVEPAEEFESQPSTAPPGDDGEARALEADPPAATQSIDPQPPPSDVETYSAEPAAPAAEPQPGEPPPSDVEAYASQAAPPSDETAAHTVPATEVGESTQCPRCGTENRPGLAFCRNCGQRLMAAGVAPAVERPGTPQGTQACPRCGTHNRAGTAFCQNCGANLRGAAAPGYIPPAVTPQETVAGEPAVEERTHAVLGPIVLLIAALGLAAGWLLPFPYGGGSLFERSFGPSGYGVALWNGYPDVLGGLADQAYFGFAAAIPILILLLVVLAAAGFARARPGGLQLVGLVVALVWSIGLVVLFVVVELLGSSGSDLAGMLRNLTPGGIIFFLASLITVIGTLTRFARG